MARTRSSSKARVAKNEARPGAVAKNVKVNVACLPAEIIEKIARASSTCADARSLANTCTSMRSLLSTDPRTPAHILWKRAGLNAALTRIVNDFPVKDVVPAIAYLKARGAIDDVNSLCIREASNKATLTLLGAVVQSPRPSADICALVKALVTDAGVDPNADAFLIDSTGDRGNAMTLVVTMLYKGQDAYTDDGREYATIVGALIDVGTRRPPMDDDFVLTLRIARIVLFVDVQNNELSRVILTSRAGRATRRSQVRDVNAVVNLILRR
jgi:hypothetical protein